MKLDLFLVKKDIRLKDIIQKLEKNRKEIVLVVDDDRKLIGTITDGDIRRSILKGVDLKEPAHEVMNKNPITIGERLKNHELLQIFYENSIKQLPVVNEKRIVIDIVFLEDLLKPEKIKSKAVVMAGGLGSRLWSLTRFKPKPLLEIGEKPLLQRIIENIRDSGIHDIFLTIHYKGEQIKKYFGNGSKFGLNIQYIEEKKQLGTAGAIGLIREHFDEPLIVMNADLLTQIHLKAMLDHHKKNNSVFTLAVKYYQHQIPYGVVNIGKTFIVNEIKEKPLERFFINAGIYILNSVAIELIPKNKYFDMTQLIDELLRMGKKVCAFPLSEYWIDIGQMKDYEVARNDFDANFGE